MRKAITQINREIPSTSTNKIYFTPLQNPSIHGIILPAPKTSDAKGKPDAGDAGANLIR